MLDDIYINIFFDMGKKHFKNVMVVQFHLKQKMHLKIMNMKNNCIYFET
jgi:hypothetical protein